jgi:hypothetical protein
VPVEPQRAAGEDERGGEGRRKHTDDADTAGGDDI